MKYYLVDEGAYIPITKAEIQAKGTDIHLVAVCPNQMIADNFAREGKETQRTAFYVAKGRVWEICRYSNGMLSGSRPRDNGPLDKIEDNYPGMGILFPV